MRLSKPEIKQQKSAIIPRKHWYGGRLTQYPPQQIHSTTHIQVSGQQSNTQNGVFIKYSTARMRSPQRHLRDESIEKSHFSRLRSQETRILVQNKSSDPEQVYKNYSPPRRTTLRIENRQNLVQFSSNQRGSIANDRLEPEDFKTLVHHKAHNSSTSSFENLELVTKVSRLSEMVKRNATYVSQQTRKITDHRGNFIVQQGYIILDRYQVVDVLGKGTFGIVLRCKDMQTNDHVAVKVNNSNQTKIACNEVKFLVKVTQKDAQTDNNIVKTLNYFTYKRHLCIVFELMSFSLYDCLRRNFKNGMPVCIIKRIIYQVLTMLQFIHQRRIVHCDLKPENILFKWKNKSIVKVIDFGTACEEGDCLFNYIQSRYYRAPEIILGMKYDRAIDIWSLGCIVAELYTGNPLFQGKSEHDQLFLITKTVGQAPNDWIQTGKFTKKYYIEGLLQTPEGREEISQIGFNEQIQNASAELKSFLYGCLEWNPQRRLTAQELLNHNWLLGKDD